MRLKKGLERLEARYRVRVDPGVLTRKGYLAGDDRRRADQLNEYLRDSDVRAVLLARGGYGLMRILDLLDADALLRDPKLLVGFSDATALLGWARNAAGVRCIHGPMVAQLGDLPHRDVEWLFRSMEDPRPFGRLPVAFSPVGAHNSVERVEGPLTGGNLCLLSHLVGTPYCPDFAGSVLAFEDVGERPYRIDRYLTHLGLAGLFDHIAGVLVGDLTDCEETTRHDHPRALAVVDERLCRYGVAGLCGVPFGHGKRNLALPLGARCAIDVRRGELHLVEAAVS